jgi:hypothetical protein
MVLGMRASVLSGCEQVEEAGEAGSNDACSRLVIRPACPLHFARSPPVFHEHLCKFNGDI